MNPEHNNPAPDSPIITGALTCRHCQAMLNVDRAAIIGESQQERLLRCVVMMAQHLQQDHPEALNSAALTGSQLQGILIGFQFRMGDPQMQAQADMSRHFVFRNTRRVLVPDEELQRQAASIGTSPENTAAIFGALQALRDLLYEENLYPAMNTPQIVPPFLVRAAPAPQRSANNKRHTN